MILHSEDKIMFIREQYSYPKILLPARCRAWSSAKYKELMDEQRKISVVNAIE